MHLVHKASIELNTDANREPGALRHWVQHSLLEELDDVLTDAIPNDQWIDADKLELNLNLDIYDEGDRSRIRHQLQEQVRHWVTSQQASMVIKPASERMAEIFTQYLQSGTIPSPRQAQQLEQWLTEQAETESRLPVVYATVWLRIMQQLPAFERGWQLLNHAGAWTWAMLSAFPQTEYRQLQLPQAWLDLEKQLSTYERKRLWQNLVKLADAPVEQQIQEVTAAFEKNIAAILPQLPGALAKVLYDSLHQTTAGTQQHYRPKKGSEKAASAETLSSKTSGAPANTNTAEMPAKGIEAENAGLVLLAPFLPAFFQNIHGASWQENAPPGSNGPALLHYLATGQTEAQEWQLVLPKLLCGIPLSQSCATSFEPGERVITETTELLQSVIDLWGKLGNTSPDGLRVNYLQRSGLLSQMADHYEIRIAEQAADILLNYLPWNYKLIRLPWMQQMLFVHWT
jgi:hypothetical protein